MTTPDDDAWSDPDRAVQIEDDNPESLAGAMVAEPADEDDAQEDFPSDPPSSDAGVANLPASDVPADGAE